MSTPTEPTTDQLVKLARQLERQSPCVSVFFTDQLVKLARQLERQLARRRALRVKLAQLDAEILTTRRFLNELTRPFAQETDHDELGSPSPRAEPTQP